MPNLDTVHIGFDNFFTRAGVTVTNPASWTTPARAYDGMDMLLAYCAAASPTRYTVDLGVGLDDAPTFLYIGLTNAGKNAVSITVESSDDNIAWTVRATRVPTTDVTSVTLGFTGLAVHRYWRVAFTGTLTGLVLGEIVLGRSCQFQIHPDVEGFDPTDEQLNVMAARTEAGHIAHSRFLGGTRNARVRISYVAETWVDDSTAKTGFMYWVDNIVLTGKPFLWAWNAGDPGAYPRDSFWAKAKGGVKRTMANSNILGMRMVDFELIGGREWGVY